MDVLENDQQKSEIKQYFGMKEPSEPLTSQSYEDVLK